jgi:hypothetical protein
LLFTVSHATFSAGERLDQDDICSAQEEISE